MSIVGDMSRPTDPGCPACGLELRRYNSRAGGRIWVCRDCSEVYRPRDAAEDARMERNDSADKDRDPLGTVGRYTWPTVSP